MTLIYHGTSLGNALGIARDRAILSHWYQIARDVRGSFGKNLLGGFPNEEAYIKHFGKGVEDVVLDIISRGEKSKNEINRKTTISLTARKEVARQHSDNGLILGCEISPQTAQTFPKYWEEQGGVFVPKKFGIDTLRQIYIDETILDENEEKIESAFARYSPRYFVMYRDGKEVDISDSLIGGKD
ncbi:hypothetical protein J4462_03985 [Candidatus Pacearchaeota archaeon]|nr:hypothetical protein [Candidatus Pacearchaeota archaeon]